MTEKLPWILESGLCAETEAVEKINAFLRQDGGETLSDAIILAFYANRFWAARGDCFPASLPEPETLLEARICRPDAELWAHRSRLGAAFAWRIADDAALRTREAPYRFPTVQLLDIARRGKKNEYGCLELQSSTGGRYALPISDNDACVKIVNYVSYDENGIAGVVDFRVVGFAPLGKEAE